MGKQLSYGGNGVGIRNNPNIFVPILTVVFFIILVSISVYKMFYDVKISSDIVVLEDLKVLADSIHQIDKDCKILAFEHQKIRINFLTVKEFAGSEIGSIGLMYPRKWKGPYVKDNPEIQGKEYQIVRTKKGYFITPGDGVKLSNGKVVGKDIILDENSDIQKMAADPKALNFDGKPLAVKLNIGKRVFSKIMSENILQAQQDLASNVHVTVSENNLNNEAEVRDSL